MRDGFVQRYPTRAAAVDGLPPGEGAFLRLHLLAGRQLALHGPARRGARALRAAAGAAQRRRPAVRGVRPAAPAGCSATSRRRSPTSGWSTRRVNLDRARVLAGRASARRTDRRCAALDAYNRAHRTRCRARGRARAAVGRPARCSSRASPSASAAPTARSSRGEYGWAPPGARAAGARPRVARPRARGAGRHWLRRGRPRGRHRPPARSGAVRALRRGRVGHVPQRRVHRARHQGARRLRLRALARRAGRSPCGSTQRSGGSACWSSRPAWWPRPGTRSTASADARLWRRSRVLVTGAGPIGLLAALLAVQRGLDVHVLDRVTDGPKPRAGPRPRRTLPHRRRGRARAARGHRRRVHRRRTGRARRDGAHRRLRDRLPHGRLVRRARHRASTSAR